MVIRCKNCFKILHHQERFCTRCGAESLEVVEVMKNGEPVLSEWQKAKMAMVICFLISFLLTGFFSVVMGLLFRQFNPNIIVDEEGALPLALTAFSRGYSLLITGISTLGIISIVFRKDLVEGMKGDNINYPFTILIGGILVLFFRFLHDQVPLLTGIPSYFILYQKENVFPLTIIVIILTSYTMIEEFIFRKLLINGLNEVTIWPNFLTVIISSIIGTAFVSIIYLDLKFVVSSLIINIIMGILYLKNKENVIPNIVIRLILIAMVLL